MLRRAPETFTGVKPAEIKYLETGGLGGRGWFIDAVGSDFDEIV